MPEAGMQELLVAYGKSEAQLRGLPEEELEELFENVVDADCAEEIQNRKVMCLHWAAERGYTALLEKLLDIGNNVEGLSESQKGATPLALALLHGHQSTVKLLIDKDADVNCAPLEGNSTLHLALAQAGFEGKRATCVELIGMLLGAGANAGALDNQGCSALHRACSAALPAAVQVMPVEPMLLTTMSRSSCPCCCR
jgi:ankyrin repeat protein